MLRLCRVLFFSAKPREERIFDALRKEAVSKGDVVVLPLIWESYYNITHQTLEVLRAASLDRSATHTLKVCCWSSYPLSQAHQFLYHPSWQKTFVDQTTVSALEAAINAGFKQQSPI